MSSSLQKTRWAGWAFLIVLLALMVAFGFFLSQKKSKGAQPVALDNGVALSKPIALQQFQFTRENQAAFSNRNLKGHWSLLFFGFTHCKMVCPTTLSALNKAYQLLSSQDKKDMPQVIFISVDPHRDTPMRMKNYLANFNSNFVGLTGDAAQIQAFAKSLGIAYLRATKSDEAHYDITHSGVILVINPKGQWAGLLRSPHSGATIAKDLRLIQENT